MPKPNVSVIGIRGIPGVAGGAEIHSENLYRELSNNFEITIYARKPYFNSKPTIYEWQQIRIRYVRCIKTVYLENISSTFITSVMCLVKKPEIAHFHNIGAGLFIPLIKLRGVKTVLTYHSKNFEHSKWGSIGRRFLKLCEYISVRHADEIITVNETIADRVIKKFKRSCHVIPNGVVKASNFKSSDFIHQLGCTSGKYVLYVGRITPEKGIHVLMEAFIRLKDEFKSECIQSFKLVIVGQLNQKSKYERKVISLKANRADIIFTNYQSGCRLEELFSHAGIFVLPSFNEGHPIALLEAMTYKLPCLVSNIPELKTLNLGTNSYFKTGDADSLKNKLFFWLKSPLRNQNYNIDEYSWSKIANRTSNVFSSLLIK
jgi:glycosyltransferase involved in cell wall biosynthesis